MLRYYVRGHSECDEVFTFLIMLCEGGLRLYSRVSHDELYRHDQCHKDTIPHDGRNQSLEYMV